MTGQKLERGSGLALWRQISDQLRADIVEGRFSEDGKIPREIDLAERYVVNRHTVRRAIADLTEQGFLEARRGEGTFVSPPKLNYPVQAETRFHEIVSGQARVPHGVLISSQMEEAEDDVALKLDCAPGTPVWRFETVYSADARPISTASMWFKYAHLKRLPDDFNKTGSLTQALKLSSIDAYHRDQTEISARRATAAEADLLEVPGDSVILATHYVSRTADGAPLQFAKTRFAAERVRLIAG